MVGAAADETRTATVEISPYAETDIDELIAMPSSRESERAFAMNRWLGDDSGVGIFQSSVPEPGRTVLFFEAEYGSPLSGGPELLPAEPRGPSGYIIVFVDGHVETLSVEDVETLIWQPQDR